MQVNTAFAVFGPIEGVVLIQSPVTIMALIAAVLIVIGLLLGLVIGLLINRTRTPKSLSKTAAPAAAAQSDDEDEIVAVIAATVLAMESARTGTQLVLRGITHVGTEGTPWSAAGRKNLMK